MCFTENKQNYTTVYCIVLITYVCLSHKNIMKTKILLITFLFLSTLSFAQSNNTYKGVVVDKNKTPLDVFSVVIFNVQDTSKQVFTIGNFDHLSMRHKDIRLDLNRLTDTIVMPTKSMVLQDAAVEGKQATI